MSTTMSTPALSRRSFLATTGVAAGGLLVSFHVPFAQASTETPEVNAWVIVQPDETVVIRIARSEMGQGTLTGLAQLVAEELECDWARVHTEFPTPGQNLARKRVWGDMSTGGSRGIRTSHDYVRRGGATARMMLVQAAADASRKKHEGLVRERGALEIALIENIQRENLNSIEIALSYQRLITECIRAYYAR